MANQNGLNGSQKKHLLFSCEYADKLLSEASAILYSAQSKSAFPKYKGVLAPVQIRVVEDYIARIRSQMLLALQSQSIPIPEPGFQVSYSLKVALTFAAIAFDECTADRMRGYGDVPADVAPQLNGLVAEIKAMLDQLNGYLSQGLDQDPAERLRRLQQTGGEIELLRKLGYVIAEQGLVDYRSRLSAILDRLESKHFEIALFGRVSSGKSSLLNHIVGWNVLPVGVNPITAVPTRIAFGAVPRILVTTPTQNREVLEIDRISEFVTEQENPANRKRVERLVVELPSSRLKDGIVLVDTPGLGSLASAGAAETLAYLPRCDLGVVLIDAGSTLTSEDLSTLQALNEAAIRTIVLLSKADVLAEDDINRARQYIAQQIRGNLRLELPVRAVSVQTGYSHLLDRWFAEDLEPLYQQHQQLTRESLRRKIGALRDAVSGVLQARLDRATHRRTGSEEQQSRIGDAEDRLRRASGRFEEVRQQWYEQTLELRVSAPAFLHEVAKRVAEEWRISDSTVTWESLSSLITIAAAGKASAIRNLMEGLAKDLSAAIGDVSGLLGEDTSVAIEELSSVVKEMPRIDLGSGDLDLTRPWIAGVSFWLTARYVERQLHHFVAEQMKESLSTYASMLDTWSRRVAGELQLKFNSYADSQRMRLGCLAGSQTTDEEVLAIRAALQDLAGSLEVAAETQNHGLLGSAKMSFRCLPA